MELSLEPWPGVAVGYRVGVPKPRRPRYPLAPWLQSTGAPWCLCLLAAQPGLGASTGVSLQVTSCHPAAARPALCASTPSLERPVCAGSIPADPAREGSGPFKGACRGKELRLMGLLTPPPLWLRGGHCVCRRRAEKDELRPSQSCNGAVHSFMEPPSGPWVAAGVPSRGPEWRSAEACGAGHPCPELRSAGSLPARPPLRSSFPSAPAASATLTWRSPTSAPWTGSCWAQRPRPAKRPSGFAAPPSHLPSSRPGTTSGSSSTPTPPAPARPRASVCRTSEVVLAAGWGRAPGARGLPGPRQHPLLAHNLLGLPQQPRPSGGLGLRVP